MMRVTTLYAGSATATARYYTRYLTNAPGEEAGVWQGAQATSFGLSGKVSTEALERLLSGHHPMTDAPLGYPLTDRTLSTGKTIRAVAGFDATVSAPKSLSAWWALTGDQGLAQCHDVAVRAVVDHLERYGATTRVRSNGSRQHPDTLGLTVAAFRQTTSRLDDPQLHTHLVISAKVQTVDGRWLALDARFLKRHQRALGGLYQSVLRAELTHRYGVAFGEIVNGQAEIAGVPPELLAQFSKRAAEVDAALKVKIADFVDRQGRDPTRFERAALGREAAVDTRGHKTGNGVPDLRTRWRHEAEALGITADTLAAGIADAARQRPAVSAVAVQEVIGALSEAGSVWHRADIVRATCDLQRPLPNLSGGRWLRVLDRAVDKVLEHCIDLDPTCEERTPRRESDGRSLWIEPVAAHVTSEAVLAEEEQILTWAMAAQSDPPSPSTSIDGKGLDVFQLDAAAAAAGSDRLVLIVGPAGAGKTTMLSAAIDDLHRHGRPVFGIAPTAKAARVLEHETRMPSDTVAKLLHESSQPDQPPRPEWSLPVGTTIVVDEAGALATGDLARLIHLADQSRWRLVLVGDPHQLQAVGRGGLLAELCATGRTVELQHVHRFTHRWEAAASLMLRHGDPRALDQYERHGRIIAGSFDEHLDTIAERWLSAHERGATTAVTTTTNDHVDEINRHIQGVRLDRGELDPRRWAPIAGGEYAHVDDVIATRRNDRRCRTSHGDIVRNRELWTVTQISETGDLTVSRIGGPGVVTLPADYVREHVRLGYAATEPGIQSDTVDTGITLATPATTRRGLYVAMTRGRDENLLLVVTDTHEMADAHDVLEGILASDRSDTPAVTQRRVLDHQQPRQTSPREQSVRPRCEIPDWFEPLRAEVGAEIAAMREELTRAAARREQHAAKLSAAQEQAESAWVAVAPFDDSIRSARVRRDTAVAERDAATHALASAKRFARRPAREALAAAELRVAHADAHFQAALVAAAPAQRAVYDATLRIEAIRDADQNLTMLERATHPVERIEQLAQRQQALVGWHRWASGESVTRDELVAIRDGLYVDNGARDDGRLAALTDVVAEWASLHGVDLSARHIYVPGRVGVEPPSIGLDL